MARLVLLLFSSSAFAHPGHGALEVHWHFDDLMWILLVLIGIGLLIKKKVQNEATEGAHELIQPTAQESDSPGAC